MDKTYIKGSFKEIDGKYGSFFNMSFKLEDLQELANDKGYINLTISKRKEVGQYGDTHSIVLNEYKPKSKDEGVSDISIEDVPF